MNNFTRKKWWKIDQTRKILKIISVTAFSKQMPMNWLNGILEYLVIFLKIMKKLKKIRD